MHPPDADAELARIIRTYGDALSRLAWGYCRHASDHDDLVQDVLVALWRALPRFRGESSERTFVFRVAHNRGLTFRARQHVHDPLTDAEVLVDSRAGPDVELDQAQRRERLRAAVRRLPESQRQTVMLHLEGFSAREIAALQGTSENNVAVRLTRARHALHGLLGGEDE
jgi:RNA polymerase sigma factor (sigma-70 family)